MIRTKRIKTWFLSKKSVDTTQKVIKTKAAYNFIWCNIFCKVRAQSFTQKQGHLWLFVAIEILIDYVDLEDDEGFFIW